MRFYKPNFTTIPFVNAMVEAAEAHLRASGFCRVTAPRIVPASGACESIDTLFEVSVDGDQQWFGEGINETAGIMRSYLTQTVQLYLESLLGEGSQSKLYSIGSSFRAEPKIDERHLIEFEMIEIEFIGGFDELLQEIENFIGALVKRTLAIPAEERSRYGLPEGLEHLAEHPDIFPKIKYQDSIEELGLTWGDDISSRQEQQLISNHGGGPIFIVRFPNPESPRMKKILESNADGKAIKFFNMIPDPKDPEHVLSADCIVPYGGECVGAASRVYEYEEFKQRLFSSLMYDRLRKRDPNAAEGFRWYLQMLRTFSSYPHSGCGFGLSRIFQYLCAQSKISQVVTFPSNKARLY